jgi:hypothetical protein
MQPSRFQTFVEYLLDNLFDIVTIVVAGYLVIRHQVQPFASTDIAELATWILAVLGLIAVSGLWDRNRRLHRIEKLSEEGRNLALRYLSRKVRASDFFLSEQRVSEKDLSSAYTVFLVGKTLTRTTREFMYVFRRRLVAGATIRFIILDPESDVTLQQAVLQSFDAPIDYWRDTLRAVETVIDAVAKTPGNTGKVEIGYLPFLPSFGLLMIDPDQSHGVCFVELYHHRSAESNPTFELRATDDPHWYRFFREQFDLLWKSCRVKTLHQESGAVSVK